MPRVCVCFICGPVCVKLGYLPSLTKKFEPIRFVLLLSYRLTHKKISFLYLSYLLRVLGILLLLSLLVSVCTLL